VEVNVHDPLADEAAALSEYGLLLRKWDELPLAEAAIFAVAHRKYCQPGQAANISCVKPGGAVIDVKSILDIRALEERGFTCWRL
jgi:UDP-N-acetyl-D-galactosamine dehydrogenase